MPRSNLRMNEVGVPVPWNCYSESTPLSSFFLFGFIYFFFFPLLEGNALAVQTKSRNHEKNPSEWRVITLVLLKALLRCYLHAQDSTVMLGYTLRTTFLFSSKNKMLRDDILSGTQHGSGIPGTTPTALTMLWMVAWLDGFKAFGIGNWHSPEQ